MKCNNCWKEIPKDSRKIFYCCIECESDYQIKELKKEFKILTDKLKKWK